MRLKLMIENFKHHFVLSLFILICMIFISGIFIVSLESDEFLLHVSHEEYKNANNSYDIVIKSNSGIYLGNVDGENDEYANSYKRKNGLYNTSLVIGANNQETIVEVFEGTKEDLFDVFEIEEFNTGETVITDVLAKELGIVVGDVITIYLDEVSYTYQVSNITKGEGLASEASMFIVGDRVAKHYNLGISGLCNLILLEIANEKEEERIYNYLKEKFSIYNVNYINDLEYIASLHSSAIDSICNLMATIIIFVLFLLVKIYRNKLKKQIDYFELIGKKKYYLSYQILVWSIVIIISFILGFVIAAAAFSTFYDLFNCKVPFVMSIKTYIITICIMILIVAILLLPKNKINKLPKKVYLACKYAILLIEAILLIIFNKHVLFGLFLIVFSITLIVHLISLIFNLAKHFKDYLTRVYIYNFCKHSIISRLILLVEIVIIAGITIGLTVITYHLKEYDNFIELLKIDSVVATKYKVDTSELFDEVRVDNNAIICGENIHNVFSFNTEQLSEYTNFSLTTEETKKYESSEKYIILPLSYRNRFNLQVGDKIDVHILNKDEIEEFEVLKFVDILYDKMAIVNKSDVMYYGYIMKENTTYEDIRDVFSETSYNLYNVSSIIRKNSKIHIDVVTIIKYVLIGILVLLILFSIYLGFLEYKYQEDSLRKMKILGCSFKKWIKPALIKFIISMIVCFGCGFIWASIITNYIDTILIFFHTIFHISFNFQIVLIASSFSIVSLTIGFISACYQFKKL